MCGLLGMQGCRWQPGAGSPDCSSHVLCDSPLCGVSLLWPGSPGGGERGSGGLIRGSFAGVRAVVFDNGMGKIALYCYEAASPSREKREVSGRAGAAE